jgi:hypothetical protein
MTTQSLKVEKFPGLQKRAPADIEARATATALCEAQFALDVQLHDLRSEFLHRESKLRTEFLERVAAIGLAL